MARGFWVWGSDSEYRLGKANRKGFYLCSYGKPLSILGADFTVWLREAPTLLLGSPVNSLVSQGELCLSLAL